jgi:hypothetical protein
MEWKTGQSGKSKVEMLMKNGLYANIHRKQERIANGSGEKMNKDGSKNAPTAKDFKESAKTAKPQSRKDMIRQKMKDM